VNLDIDDPKRAEHALQLSEASLTENKARLEEASTVSHMRVLGVGPHDGSRDLGRRNLSQYWRRLRPNHVPY
jgi:hypothetical protein